MGSTRVTAISHENINQGQGVRLNFEGGTDEKLNGPNWAGLLLSMRTTIERSTRSERKQTGASVLLTGEVA